MKSKIIFLDIDGVITTLESKWKLDKNKMLLVKQICDATNAKIVITSSWREGNLQNTLIQLTTTHRCTPIPFLMPELVVGITDFVYGKTNNGEYCFIPRGVEIQRYLDWHSEITNYVIIDDDSDLLLSQKDHFVHTDTYKGISKENVKQAIEILNNDEFN